MHILCQLMYPNRNADSELLALYTHYENRHEQSYFSFYIYALSAGVSFVNDYRNMFYIE